MPDNEMQGFPRIVSQVVVGSQLHGLANEQSDTDTATIVASPVLDLISPFRSQKGKHNVGDEKDETTFELSHFVKLIAQCNPTALEALWSNRVLQDSQEWQELQRHRTKVLNSKRIFDAHHGYATHQRRIVTCNSDKKRIGKAAAANIRVLVQGISLLKDGDFSPQLLRHIEMVRELKRCVDHHSWLYQEALRLIEELEKEIKQAYESKPNWLVADIDFLEAFLYGAYVANALNLIDSRDLIGAA